MGCFVVLARTGEIIDPRRFSPAITEVIAKISDDVDDHYDQCDREEDQNCH